MKGIVIRQPWAELIAAGVKTLETRSWKTRYRGPLAIVAGKTPDTAAGDRFGMDAEHLTRGAIVAVVDLIDFRPMQPKDEPAAHIPYDPTLNVWQLDNPRPVRGAGVGRQGEDAG